TDTLDRLLRQGLGADGSETAVADAKMAARRTFQALRIAVNQELSSLDALLRVIPMSLGPGGRVAIITFHSGEDRRVKKAFQEGHRAGLYSEIARDVVRSRVEETRANRRAQAAKLRWAVKAL
nr:16S rRNA (cytosine(1402)-N(4))-methyltransferase [Acidobacteriota bacterium]